MKAVVLAAGRGTRLGALTANTPKPMILINEKPVLEHIVKRIQTAGINDFVFVTRYLGEKIEEYFGDGSKFGINVQYAPQDDKYGTGAGLLAAKKFAGNDDVMMVYGDVITPETNYSGVRNTFDEKKCDAVLSINWTDDPWRGGAVMIDEDGKLKTIVEKPPQGEIPSNWNSAGIMCFKNVIFDYLEQLNPSPRGEYELPDSINKMADNGLTIWTYKLSGYWNDVGTVEDIAIAEKMLKESKK